MRTTPTARSRARRGSRAGGCATSPVGASVSAAEHQDRRRPSATETRVAPSVSNANRNGATIEEHADAVLEQAVRRQRDGAPAQEARAPDVAVSRSPPSPDPNRASAPAGRRAARIRPAGATRWARLSRREQRHRGSCAHHPERARQHRQAPPEEVSPRMFDNPLLERLSRVHPVVPPLLYLPVVGYLPGARGRARGPRAWRPWPACSCSAWSAWSLAEYLLHRFVFHFEPDTRWGRRLHFIIHGVHHDYPHDPMRLVMPPSVSVPLAILVFLGFRAAARAGVVAAVLRGLPGRLPDLRHDALPPAPPPLDEQAQPRAAPLPLPPPLPAVRPRLRRHVAALGPGLPHRRRSCAGAAPS